MHQAMQNNQKNKPTVSVPFIFGCTMAFNKIIKFTFNW